MALIHHRATHHHTMRRLHIMRQLREFIIRLRHTVHLEPITHHIIMRLQLWPLITGMVGGDIITIILIIGTVDGNCGRETSPAGFDSAGLFFYLRQVVNPL
jgi:hypothetical protein